MSCLFIKNCCANILTRKNYYSKQWTDHDDNVLLHNIVSGYNLAEISTIMNKNVGLLEYKVMDMMAIYPGYERAYHNGPGPNYCNFLADLGLNITFSQEKDLKIESIEIENKFLVEENTRLKKLIEEKNSFTENYTLSKVLLDQRSPYLKSVIINKGLNEEIKIGSSVKNKSYFVGKIVNVNYMTSRVLLASDLNSKIPVIVEPGSLNAILSGNGNNDWAVLEYLPKQNNIKDDFIVYTSGIDGNISAGIPVGKVFIKNDKKLVKFFVDFNQLQFVKVKK